MSKRSIMKELDVESLMLTEDNDMADSYTKKPQKTKLVTKLCVVFFVMAVLGCSGFALNRFRVTNMETGDIVSLASIPIAATASKKDVITIPNGIVKANPFVPYRRLGNEPAVTGLVNDVPKYDLISPPETLGENAEASRIMDTVVSGILYDKFSPSAILNIDGNDYLVKKGDTISNYKIVTIAKDSVTVKLGNNTYTAGIGELLTEGSVNYNDVSNLSKKFGGEKR